LRPHRAPRRQSLPQLIDPLVPPSLRRQRRAAEHRRDHPPLREVVLDGQADRRLRLLPAPLLLPPEVAEPGGPAEAKRDAERMRPRFGARERRGHARQRLVRTPEQTRSPAVKDQTPDAGVSSAEIEWARRHRLGEAEAAREVGTAGLELAEEDED